MLSVSELTAGLRRRLEDEYPSVWVEGEISNFKHHGSGHMYFTLKDAQAQLAVVMFRGSNHRLRFRPGDGLEVVVNGNLTVYDRRGNYQLIAQRMEPRGLGALQLAFEQLKARLAAEGLFDESRKRPLPRLPRRIALVTSGSGAAVRDVLRVLRRRFPPIHVTLIPVLVQGPDAAHDIVRGIRLANRSTDADLLIVGRGGGSLEDLQAFNTEAVARAIADSSIPTLSAVGHEVDVTIADFVADRRAATPSAAAEIAVPELQAIEHRLRRLGEGLRHGVLRRLREQKLRADRAERLLAQCHPVSWLRRHQQRLDELGVRLDRSLERVRHQRLRWQELANRLRSPRESLAAGRTRHAEVDRRLHRIGREGVVRGRERIEAIAAQLEALSPVRVLERGYSITTGEGTSPVLDASKVTEGDRVTTRLARGSFTSRVESVEPEEKEGRDPGTRGGRLR